MSPAEVVHSCPADGGRLMPCCERTPFEVPRIDRITLNPDLVTCGGQDRAESPAWKRPAGLLPALCKCCGCVKRYCQCRCCGCQQGS